MENGGALLKMGLCPNKQVVQVGWATDSEFLITFIHVLSTLSLKFPIPI